MWEGRDGVEEVMWRGGMVWEGWCVGGGDVGRLYRSVD